MNTSYISFDDLKPFFVILSIILSTLTSWVLARRNIPRSYRIAVIGFPQVGKTSLITALFAYLFQRGIRGASLVPRGEETINRINAHIADMDSGRGVAPTRDQDLFAYRADVQPRSAIGFFSSKYKLEIGDFPGEQSQEFVESEQPWLHNTNYFQWAMGADAFLFVVDSYKCLLNKDNYVSKQKSAFRAAWQRIQGYHIDGSSSLRQKVVILVYSKADQALDDVTFAAELMPLNFKMAKLHSHLDSMFSDLIDCLKRDTTRFKTGLTSVVIIYDKERLGIADLANSTLPY